jgi:nicotinamide mononucleotide (NMN) deamidase PncC/nicotinic acid mononucleotide adenylyltransferase
VSDLISRIHETDGRFEIAVTGGGASVISQLLSVPGASNSLLNAVVPYSFEALSHYIGTEPEGACSEHTARRMASRAYLSATGKHKGKVLGIGATAALQTNRLRRGADRIHVAVQARRSLKTYRLDLNSELSRIEQEAICANFILTCLSVDLGVGVGTPPQPSRELTVSEDWAALFARETHLAAEEPITALLPGAFNPPHAGHFEMRRLAEKHLQQTVHFELSVDNVDKPPLDYFDMRDRQILLDHAPVAFTRAATFVEKSELCPGATFVIGIDTLTRIDDIKYYHHSVADKEEALQTLASRGHRFLVFGRLVDDRFQGALDVELSSTLKAMCQEIPESEFRLDISSTELREKLIRTDE